MHKKKYCLQFFIIFLICICLSTFAHAERSSLFVKDIIISKHVSSRSEPYLDKTLLLTEIESAIGRTNKFKVLTRQKEYLKTVRKEQKFSKSVFTAGDAAFENQISNADAIVMPEVLTFSFYRESKPIPNLAGKYQYRNIGALEMNIKVIDTTTAQILASFPLKQGFATKRQISSQKGGVPSKSYFSEMAKKISVKIADAIVDHAFPMKVVKVKNLKVWLNRGKDGGLSARQKLYIYSPGEALIDPDTGMNIGSAEEYVGVLRIIRVNPKFSVGEIVNKEKASLVSAGCIVRKIK